MVERTFTNGKFNEYAGLSTDPKPTVGVGTGSIFIEVDTGSVYLYDEASGWVGEFNFQNQGVNPNSYSVINGTLANPFGSVDKAELGNAIYEKNATAYIMIDLRPIGFLNEIGGYCVGSSSLIDSVCGSIAGGSPYSLLASYTWRLSSGTWDFLAYVYEIGLAGTPKTISQTNIKSRASEIPTTLTIIWHPMT